MARGVGGAVPVTHAGPPTGPPPAGALPGTLLPRGRSRAGAERSSMAVRRRPGGIGAVLDPFMETPSGLQACACQRSRLAVGVSDSERRGAQVFAASWVEDEVQKSFTLTPFRSPAVANIRGARPRPGRPRSLCAARARHQLQTCMRDGPLNGGKSNTAASRRARLRWEAGRRGPIWG